jgi:uncharacterized protein (TIGR02145 family)
MGTTGDIQNGYSADLARSQIDKNNAESEKLRLEAELLKKQSTRSHFVLTRILPIGGTAIISSAAVTFWVLSFLRPVVQEKNEYREFRLMNIENRLTHRGDSLQEVSNKLQYYNQKLESEKRLLLSAIDNMQTTSSKVNKVVVNFKNENRKVVDSIINVFSEDLSAQRKRISSSSSLKPNPATTGQLSTIGVNDNSIRVLHEQSDYISFADSVKDKDGNVYKAVKIGNQVWTVANLRTTKYNDGTPIPLVTDNSSWGKLTTPGYCYYNNMENPDSVTRFGALYNWYAIHTGKLAPKGWHIPTKAEWDSLQTYLIANGYNWDGTTTGNEIAKALAAKTGWGACSIDGAVGYDMSLNNKSGFSAFPGGYRYGNSRDHSVIGNFYFSGNYGYWWSITEFNDSTVYGRFLDFGKSNFCENSANKRQGQSVRLLKDR